MELEDDDLAAARTTRKEVNAMIASELNNLTSTERDAILNEVHGVGDLAPEERNAIVIEEKLRQMDLALRSMPVDTVFDEAQRLCAGKRNVYVNDPAFRIRFLRAAQYDVENATSRMIANLNAIREAYGPECLTRPIYLSDMMLDQGSDTYLYSGNCLQVMPFRDRLGRRIIVRSGRQMFDENTTLDADYKTRVCHSCIFNYL